MHWDRGDIEEPGFCRYAAETMIPLILGLEQELSGIVTSDDIEYIHRARVATRRLRACFSNFSSCFSNRATAEWRDDIKRITRSLGEARDLDVQIEFIESCFNEYKEESLNTFKIEELNKQITKLTRVIAKNNAKTK